MHGNDMQMMLCTVKLGVLSSICGDFWEETGWRGREGFLAFMC